MALVADGAFVATDGITDAVTGGREAGAVFLTVADAVAVEIADAEVGRTAVGAAIAGVFVVGAFVGILNFPSAEIAEASVSGVSPGTVLARSTASTEAIACARRIRLSRGCLGVSAIAAIASAIVSGPVVALGAVVGSW